jgi:integrase
VNLTTYWGEQATTYFKCKKICQFVFYDKFDKLLELTKLTEDRAWHSRTLYSLRHTYATQALLDGTDLQTIANQFGGLAHMKSVNSSFRNSLKLSFRD